MSALAGVRAVAFRTPENGHDVGGANPPCERVMQLAAGGNGTAVSSHVGRCGRARATSRCCFSTVSCAIIGALMAAPAPMVSVRTDRLMGVAKAWDVA